MKLNVLNFLRKEVKMKKESYEGRKRRLSIPRESSIRRRLEKRLPRGYRPKGSETSTGINPPNNKNIEKGM